MVVLLDVFLVFLLGVRLGVFLVFILGVFLVFLLVVRLGVLLDFCLDVFLFVFAEFLLFKRAVTITFLGCDIQLLPLKYFQVVASCGLSTSS